jgi:hypothetical protein
MESGHAPDSGELDSLHDLLAGLGGTLGSGDLLGWAAAGGLADVPGEVYGVIGSAGLLGDGARPPSRPAPGRARPARDPASVPGDAAALMSLLWEVDEESAIGLLASLVAGSRPKRGHHWGQRPDQAEPQDVFDELVRLLGPDSRWWTNTDLTTWNQITAHAFDAVVVGAGDGVIVTLIAFEGGG